jgi:ectoine hydroxylase-related dioxygenase (phytanoyl-CoA dioxygenase family)
MTQEADLDLRSELGLRDDLLEATTRSDLDRDGVAILQNHMSPDLLDALREAFDRIVAEEEAAGVSQREPGATTIVDVVGKGEIFEQVWADPTLLTAADHVIREPFKMLAMNARAALPGAGLQALHADWGKPAEPGRFKVINSLWMLDDFTEQNGATRYLPGTHRSPTTPGEALTDPLAPHPDEHKMVAPAGSVALMNAHTWHGGTVNRTDRPRRAVHCAFVTREHPQHTTLRDFLPREMVERLTPAQRWLLDA